MSNASVAELLIRRILCALYAALTLLAAAVEYGIFLFRNNTLRLKRDVRESANVCYKRSGATNAGGLHTDVTRSKTQTPSPGTTGRHAADQIYLFVNSSLARSLVIGKGFCSARLKIEADPRPIRRVRIPG